MNTSRYLPLVFCLSVSAAFSQAGTAPGSASPAMPLATYTAYGTGCRGSGNSTHSGVIVPQAYATQMGNSNNYYPFGRANMRYQQVFLATEFRNARVLQALALRQTNTTTGRTGGQQTISLSLGVTTLSHSTLTNNYAGNFNSGSPTQLFNGTINIPTLTGVNQNPAMFAMTIRFTRPYLYPATAGNNLLLEVVNTSSSSVTQFWDAASGSTVTSARVYATPSTAATGTLQRNYGVIMCFQSVGSGGAVPVLANTGRPVLNQSFTIDLSQARATAPAVLITGLSRTQWGPFQLPLDLTPAGAPGCQLLCGFDFAAALATDASGSAQVKLAIPNDTRLNGAGWFNQFAILDQVNALGLVFSNGGAAVIGDQ